MRSRYSAFTQNNTAYLLSTRSPLFLEFDEQKTLEDSMQNTQWLGLRVLQSTGSSLVGQVEFVAFFRLKNTPNAPVEQLHERSSFVYDQRWLYTQGDPLPPIKLQRNDPCFCGSAKKYKKCCGS